MGREMNDREPIFRIFVSSTFSDMEAEREALQAAFDELTVYCNDRGARFQAIDLRWGISEEAGRDQLTLNICLDEIRRCQALSPRPNFIVLLGDRYGSRPLPLHLDADVMVAIKECDPGLFARLKPYYPCDENAKPPRHVLTPQAVHGADLEGWDVAEINLRTALASVDHAILGGTDALEWFERSYTHHEIALGLLDACDAKTHVFGYTRNISGLPDDRRAAPYVDFDADGNVDWEVYRRQQKLKQEIRDLLSDRVLNWDLPWSDSGIAPPLSILTERVREHLQSVIDKELASWRQRPADEIEIQSHTAFAAEKAAHFQGRAEPLARIASYLSDATEAPLVVYGPSGLGKSALIARALQEAEEKRPVYRFIGATAASTVPTELLWGLCAELGSPADDSDDVFELGRRFRAALADGKRGKPVVVFIDGLDQLSGDGRNLGWLPRTLPAGAKLVVSVVGPEDRATPGIFTTLRRFVLPGQFVHLGPMDRDGGRSILREWLDHTRDGARCVRGNQEEHVLDAFEAAGGSPLFMKFAFEDVRHWRSFDGIPAKAGGRYGVATTLDGIVVDFLSELMDRRRHGPVLTRHALCYLAVSRHGLAESEMVEALSSDPDVMTDFLEHSSSERAKPAEKRLKKLPPLIWSRLFADIEPYLAYRNAGGTRTLDFFHRQLRRVVESQIVNAASARLFHRRLATLFGRQRHRLGADGKLPSLRKLAEWPFHLCGAGAGGAELSKALCDLRFVEANCRAGRGSDLIADCERAIASCSDTGIAVLNRILKSIIGELKERPHYSLAIITNALRWSGELTPALRRRMAAAANVLDRRGPWIEAASRPPGSVDSVTTVFGHPAGAQALSCSGRWLASTADGERVDIYDLDTGTLSDVRVIDTAWPKAMVVEDGCGRLAWIAGGSLHVESALESIVVGNRERVIAWHETDGVVVARDDGALVLWQPGGEAVILAEGLPGRVVALSVAGDRILFAAGEGLGQLIGLAQKNDGRWQTRWLRGNGGRYEGEPVRALCLGDGFAVFAAADRSLKRVSIDSGAIESELFYERQAAVILRGVPIACAAWMSHCYAATADGHVFSWDGQGGAPVRLDSFGHKQSQEILENFAVRKSDGRLLLSTQTGVRAVGLEERKGLREGHDATVSDCCFCSDDTIASVSRDDSTVRWWASRGLEQAAIQSFGAEARPCRVAPLAGGMTIVGYDNGKLAVMDSAVPEKRPALMDKFNTPVIGLFNDARGNCFTGDITARIFRFDPKTGYGPPIRDGNAMTKLDKLINAEPFGEYWSMRSDQLYGGTFSTVSIGKGKDDETILQTLERLSDIAVTDDGATLAVAGRRVQLFQRVDGRWRETETLDSPTDLVAFPDGDVLVAVPAHSLDLEIRSLKSGLPLVAAFRVGRTPVALAARGNRIVIGCRSGEVVSLVLRGVGKNGGTNEVH